MPGKIKGKIGNAICHIYLIILSVVAAFPLIWVLLCSVKSAGDLTSNPTSIFPKEFNFIIGRLWDCEILSQVWKYYVTCIGDYLYVSSNPAGNPIYAGYGKAWVNQYTRRPCDRVFIIQRTLCSVDADWFF